MLKLRVMLVALLVALGLMTVSQTANAWPWDSHVTVWGYLVHCGYGDQTARVDAVLNGERHVQDTNPGSPPKYQVTFTNVPSNGGWAWIVVYCTVSGDPQGYWVKVTRPLFGTNLQADLT